MASPSSIFTGEASVSAFKNVREEEENKKKKDEKQGLKPFRCTKQLLKKEKEFCSVKRQLMRKRPD